jgi:hypothetical protein
VAAVDTAFVRASRKPEQVAALTGGRPAVGGNITTDVARGRSSGTVAEANTVATAADLVGARFIETYGCTHLFELADGRFFVDGPEAVDGAADATPEICIA